MSLSIDPLFGSIQVASSIKIKRSDGRVHLAKVVQLSPDSKSVGVEWNEQGEVKGKEILLDLVFELNAELRPQLSKAANQAKPSTAIPVALSGLSSSRLTLDIDSLEREYSSRPPPTLPAHLLQRIQQHPVSIQTTSTPLPPPPLNGYVFTSVFSPRRTQVPASSFLFAHSAPLPHRQTPMVQRPALATPLLFAPSVVPLARHRLPLLIVDCLG